MFGYDPENDRHRFNPNVHYRLYLSHRGEGPVVICVQDFDYYDYNPDHFLSNEAWDNEADAENAVAKLRADLATTLNAWHLKGNGLMEEPKRKKQSELWTVEAGEYEDHNVLGTFTLRTDAEEYRDRYNARPGLSRGSRATIGTIEHNPTI